MTEFKKYFNMKLNEESNEKLYYISPWGKKKEYQFPHLLHYWIVVNADDGKKSKLIDRKDYTALEALKASKGMGTNLVVQGVDKYGSKTYPIYLKDCEDAYPIFFKDNKSFKKLTI